MAEAVVSFEDRMSELERVVEQLERGDLNLESSVALFERGVELSNACRTELSGAEARIQRLVRPSESGPVEVEDLAMAVEEGEDEDDAFDVPDPQAEADED